MQAMKRVITFSRCSRIIYPSFCRRNILEKLLNSFIYIMFLGVFYKRPVFRTKVILEVIVSHIVWLICKVKYSYNFDILIVEHIGGFFNGDVLN